MALMYKVEAGSPSRMPPLLDRVCAIIVTYNPLPQFIDNIAAINAQVDETLVVDNGSSGEAETCLKALERLPGCKVLRSPTNLGIAAALNLGVRAVENSEIGWIATFDQDSRVSDGFVAGMFETYRDAARPESIAIITPTFVDSESGVRGSILRSRAGELLTAITSGSLIPIRILKILGDFDESFFMDYVDIDYCLRARRQGLTILESPATLYHSLGRTTYHRFLGQSFAVTNHSAARRYYITRNRLRVLWRYSTDWPWAWREVKAVFVDAAKVAFVESEKWKKSRAMLVGSIDALTGRTGKQVDL